MGFRVAQNYAPVSLTFLDAFERGKCEVEATRYRDAAHRLNRICFHLMQQDEPFQNQSTPKLEGEKARRWRAFAYPVTTGSTGKAEKRKRGSRRKRGKRRARRR